MKLKVYGQNGWRRADKNSPDYWYYRWFDCNMLHKKQLLNNKDPAINLEVKVENLKGSRYRKFEEEDFDNFISELEHCGKVKKIDLTYGNFIPEGVFDLYDLEELYVMLRLNDISEQLGELKNLKVLNYLLGTA